MSESWKSRHSSQDSAATEYLERNLHKEQIPAVLTLRKPSRQDSQTNALPIKATILTVCSQEHRLSVMTQSLHLHDSMSGDLSPAHGAILIGETSWESLLRCGRRVGAFLHLGRRFILCSSFRSVRGHIKGFRYPISNQVRSPNLK